MSAARIQIKSGPAPNVTDFSPYARFYGTENQVAEHVSPPLSEEIKVTLKVSQNLQAGMGPYLLGTLVAKDTKAPLTLDSKSNMTSSNRRSWTCPARRKAMEPAATGPTSFSPDFMVHYLTYWSTRPDYQEFFKALPILGKDGTSRRFKPIPLARAMFFAKTGTFGSEDRLGGKMMLNGKGLAGYVLTKDGKRLAFAAYVNHVSLAPDPEAAQHVAGQALGEIAAAAYDANLEASEERATTISLSATVTSSMAREIPGMRLTSASAGIASPRSAICTKPTRSAKSTPRAASSLLASLTCLDSPKFLFSSTIVRLSKLSRDHYGNTGEGGSIAPQNEKNHRAPKAVSRPVQTHR